MARTPPPPDTPASFVAAAEEVLARLGPTDEGFRAVAERLRRLARRPGIVSEEHLSALHGAGSTATILHEGEDGRCALMLARFPAEAPRVGRPRWRPLEPAEVAGMIGGVAVLEG
jgi:hypothetical protein